ncbi:MAG: hypothetical protein GC162_03265 [Planctomycetes bacterium]|nr:hypothetical protein [Planctomycetota bacterium]
MWNPTVEASWLAPADKGLEALIKSYDEALHPAPKSENGTPAEPAPKFDPSTTPEHIAERAGWSLERRDLLTAALADTGWGTHGEHEYANPDSRLILTVNETGGATIVGVRNKTFLESLLNAKMWLEAAGQIFFSLSVGFGIIACYASYLKKDDDIALSSLTSCAGNEFCEVALGGLITIPAAFVFLGAAGTTGGTFGLGFNTLPLIFATMPMGQFIGVVFFFLLFLAAVTSSLSMLQPAIALFEEGLGIERKASVALLGIITAIGSGFVVYFSKGRVALETIDFWVGSFSLYVLATIEVFLFGWVMGIEKGYEELSRGSEIRVPRLIMPLIKYISPVYLLVVFAAWTYQSAGGAIHDVTSNYAAGLSVGFIGVLLIFFVILVARSVRRWDKAEAAAKETNS